MQNVSSMFHNAVLAGAPQSAYLRFSDDVFTNEDIDISGGGLRWNQAVCNETDLKIGATMSAQISCDLLNENRILRDYRFGEFEAWLGVRIMDMGEIDKTSITITSEPINGVAKGVQFGNDPYWIIVDGLVLNDQPNFEPMSLIMDRTKIYAIRNDGYVWAYDLATNSVINTSLTPHMEAKAEGFAKRGLILGCQQGEERAVVTLLEKNPQNGLYDAQFYEYCRLGVFNAERPAKLMDATVDLQAYDRMALFEKKLGKDLNIGDGMTFGAMLAQICTEMNIPLKTATFPNDSLTYSSPSEKFKAATYREIIGYIAEAAGRIARMTRDGKLELVWLNSTSVRVTPDKYSEATIYSYQVRSIDKTAIFKDEGGVTESE